MGVEMKERYIMKCAIIEMKTQSNEEPGKRNSSEIGNEIATSIEKE